MKKRYLFCFIILFLLLFVLFIMNLITGSSSVKISQIIAIFTGNYQDTVTRQILLLIRLPRALCALLLGGALAVSGFLLQSFFHNPIAGPFVLGISSGAKLTVAFVMIFCLQQNIFLSSGAMVGASFLGALISMSFVLLVSGKVKNMAMLVVSGIMIGYICSALTDLLINFANDANIINLHNWSMGTFSGTDWQDIQVIIILLLIIMIPVILLAKPMYAYQFGEEYAENMGVNIKFFRIALIFISSLLSACVTAFAGPISFVGIAVPHLVKKLFGTAKPVIILPACFLGGAVFCLLCDLLARNLFAPTELSISTVTALFGAPIVIWIMLQNKSRKGRIS
ncbi:MAG: iron ABC transporter permease [Oscillospiraceae bacterium]|nr:iron ABC transporter permease [Oscillospiraceae bacterium]